MCLQHNGPPMLIFDRIGLENFRRFRTFGMTLEPDLTLLVANNAGGKTSVLDALAVLLGAFVGAFDEGRSPQIKPDDARIKHSASTDTQEPQYPISVSATVAVAGRAEHCRRERKGPKGRTTTVDASSLRDFGKELQSDVRLGAPVDLPLVAYFGTQ